MSFLLQVLMVVATTGAMVAPDPANGLAAAPSRVRAAVVEPVPQQAIGIESTVGGSRSRPVTFAPEPTNPVKYNESNLEFYMDQEVIAFVRPGFTIQIVSITNVAPGQKPVVEVRFTDNFGAGLDRLGRTTPGTVSASFVLAWYNPDTRLYTAYTTRVQTTPANSPRPGVSAVQASADSGGTWTELGPGHYRYTFGTTMPANLDVTRTHTLSAYGSRNMTAFIPGKVYTFETLRDFRPDGQTVVHTWDKIRDVACDRCHEDISAHGTTGRTLVKGCVLCHQPQTVDPDTGHTQDMTVLMHKIHMGHNLPSVQAGTPYVIIGNAQSVHDFSHVMYPQDIRNCHNCHEVGNPAQKDVWFTQPSKRACFSCHDNIDMETGQGHPGFPASNDATCSSCHIPDSGHEFDASIKGAHTIPLKSKQLPGLNAQVISQSNFTAGQRPTVVIRLTNKAGQPVDGSKITSFAPMIAGPTSSYNRYFREAGQTRAVFDAATGNTTYTFTNAIPATATGTWVISGDFYNNATIKQAGGGPDITLRDAAYNPIRYVSLTGGTPQPRRTVVTDANCNTCHDQLRAHGDQRIAIQECVICHNPKETDTSRRPASANPPESVSMQYMIHKIHRGHALTRDYTVYGFGGVPHNYNDVGYPGDLRNCTHCHVNGTQQLPAPGESVVTPRDFFSPMGPGTAACVSCHDSRDAVAHAFINTTRFPGSDEPAESCAACHGPGKQHSVDQSHAR
jgi:OmcA/MtrC family decaheme c-type cytochrome